MGDRGTSVSVSSQRQVESLGHAGNALQNLEQVKGKEGDQEKAASMSESPAVKGGVAAKVNEVNEAVKSIMSLLNGIMSLIKAIVDFVSSLRSKTDEVKSETNRAVVQLQSAAQSLENAAGQTGDATGQVVSNARREAQSAVAGLGETVNRLKDQGQLTGEDESSFERIKQQVAALPGQG